MDLSRIPTIPPPPGVTSNFLHPHSNAKALRSITTTCIVFMFLSFIMRMYSRIWIKRTFQIDDCECSRSFFAGQLRDISRVSSGSGWYRLICACLLFCLISCLGRYDSLLCDDLLKYVLRNIHSALSKSQSLITALSVVGTRGWDVPFSKYNSHFLRVRWSLPEVVDRAASSLSFDHVQLYGIGIQMSYCPVTFLVKLSLFVLYYHLFSANRRIRILIYAGVTCNFAVYLGSLISFGIACVPRHGASWFEAVITAQCFKETTNRAYLLGVFGVISDFYLYFLPIPVILRLQLPLKKKIGVCAIFMTGSLFALSSPYSCWMFGTANG